MHMIIIYFKVVIIETLKLFKVSLLWPTWRGGGDSHPVTIDREILVCRPAGITQPILNR